VTSRSAPDRDRELLRRWVETWCTAAVDLEAIRRRELQSLDTQEAIRQIFGEGNEVSPSTGQATSGLVEQQAWFALLRAAKERE
jgi:hypothetical protein